VAEGELMHPKCAFKYADGAWPKKPDLNIGEACRLDICEKKCAAMSARLAEFPDRSEMSSS